jgi:glucose-1-phosphate cytidylyltransferase
MMKAVILAGGMGTRISEESHLRPKPMIEIGGKPIIWHIMKIYSSQGINDFVVCLGYRGYMIKEYFANYFLHMSDVTVDMARNTMQFHEGKAEPWRVTLVDTGENTMTGGRLKRARDHIGNDDFFMTYGDGVADVDIGALAAFHRGHGGLATVTAVRPQARYGALALEGTRVASFVEKPPGDSQWINGGFFVLSPKCIDYVVDDTTAWEWEPMERLAMEGRMHAYQHHGFWQPMDTLRDKTQLEGLWLTGKAPWKIWP